MTLANQREASPTVGPNASEQMAKYGITRVPTDYFHYEEYRYTSLDDAIAQAKRQHRRYHRMDANDLDHADMGAAS
jgi:hypothetical protein